MSAARERGFTVVPAVLLLAVLLVGLGTALYFVGVQPQTASKAYNRGFALGPIVGSVFVGGFFVLVASRLAERKSQGVATLVCGGILLLANVAYGVNVLRGLGVIKPLPQKGVLSAKQPMVGVQPTPQPTPQKAVSGNAGVESGAQEDREGINPRPADQPQPGATPEPRPQIVVPKGSMPRTGPKPDVTLPVQEKLSEKGQAALQELEAEIKAACGNFASDADAAYKKMRKPVTTMSALNKATEEFAALRVAAGGLEKRLRGLIDEARDRLAKAGEDEFARMRFAMEWERGMETFERANACADVDRACEAAASLFAVLKDTLGKWKVDASGKVTSPDRGVEQRLFIPRSQMMHALDRQNDVLHDLRQGDQTSGK